MKIVPLAALTFLACSTSPPASSDPPSSLGSSAEELRKLGQRDAEDLERCRALAARCAASLDGGSAQRCERVSQHCDALEEQLESDRAELEECLAEAAACEQAAADPVECEDERAQCEPAGRQLRDRRDRTLQCSSRATQCLGRGMGVDVDEEVDGGVLACDEDATDFAGCCRRGHGDAADGGVSARGERFGRAGRGFRSGRNRGGFHEERANEADAGAFPRRF